MTGNDEEKMRKGANRLKVARLTQPAEPFAPFTYPRFRPVLSHLSDGPVRVPDMPGTYEAIGAFDGDTPVGLALLQYPPENAQGENDATRLLSIMVDIRVRRKGVGSMILGIAEDHARGAGASLLVAQHSAQTKGRAAFEGLLASCEWSAPTLLEFRLSGHADWTERVADQWRPMLNRLRRQGYSSTPWAEISEADRRDAKAIVDEGLAYPLLDFSIFEPEMDPALSIALRQHGKLVGWVIGESLPTTGYHHYTCGYVCTALQPSGWLIAGVYDVCVLQLAAYGAKSVAAYETYGANTRMINFMRRKLSDVTLWMDERYQSSKALS